MKNCNTYSVKKVNLELAQQYEFGLVFLFVLYTKCFFKIFFTNINVQKPYSQNSEI